MSTQQQILTGAVAAAARIHLLSERMVIAAATLAVTHDTCESRTTIARLLTELRREYGALLDSLGPDTGYSPGS